jgi:phage shock protein E
MTWTVLAIAVAVLIIALIIKNSGRISIEDARAHLRNGALVIDVRSAGEFVAGHLPMAVNLPLSEIETNWSRRISDKNKVLLLYCQSGVRSGEARKRLIALGCPNTFNMGSYARAEEIVGRK